MQKRSVSRIGGFGALAVATFTGLFFLSLVVATRLSADPEQIVWPHVLSDYALALIGLSGLAAVPAITARVATADRELARWAATVAQFGFGVLTVMSLWQAEYETTLAVDAMNLPVLNYDVPDARVTFLENVVTRLPHGWLEVGGVGFWMFCVSLLGRKRHVLPGLLVSLGFVAGLVGVLTAFASASQLTWLAAVGQILYCVVLAPSWFLWMGSLLLEGTPAARTAAAPPAAVAVPPRRRRSYTAIVPTLRRWADRMPSLN